MVFLKIFVMIRDTSLIIPMSLPLLRYVYLRNLSLLIFVFSSLWTLFVETGRGIEEANRCSCLHRVQFQDSTGKLSSESECFGE